MAGRLHGARDEGVMRGRGAQIRPEQRPGIGGAAFGQREKREVAAGQRRPRVADDRAEPGDPPARAHERGRRRMLPTLELGDAEGDHVWVEKGAGALQHRQEAAVHLRERRLQRFGVRPAGVGQRFPAELLQVHCLPGGLERRLVRRREQPFQGRGEATQLPQRIHACNIPRRRRLSTHVAIPQSKP